MVPVFVRSSSDGVGVIRLISDTTSESVSNSLRMLSNDGIISTCGIEYSASSNYRILMELKEIWNIFFKFRLNTVDEE